MIAAIKAQTDALERLPQAIAMAVAEAVKAVQPPIVEVVTKAPETPISPVNSVNLQVLPAERPSKKLQQALDWLRDNPGHLDTPSRDIAAMVGVSHMTVNKAQRMLKGETVD